MENDKATEMFNKLIYEIRQNTFALKDMLVNYAEQTLMFLANAVVIEGLPSLPWLKLGLAYLKSIGELAFYWRYGAKDTILPIVSRYLHLTIQIHLF